MRGRPAPLVRCADGRPVTTVTSMPCVGHRDSSASSASSWPVAPVSGQYDRLKFRPQRRARLALAIIAVLSARAGPARARPSGAQEAIEGLRPLSTMGSFSLKDVFSNSGTPVRRPKAPISRPVPRIRVSVDCLQAADPSTCVTAGMTLALLGAHGIDLHHERVGDRTVEVLRVDFFQDRGSKGAERLAELDLGLMMSRMSARRGSARMLRLPSARAPHSMRPWNQPTISPSAIRAAVQSAERRLVRHDVARCSRLPAGRRHERQAAIAVAVDIQAPSSHVSSRSDGAAQRLHSTHERRRRARCRCRRPPAE